MVDNVSCRSETTALRRQAILQAALKSFLTKGFNETTMEDIRQLSGASMGSIYHHFENKERLALALYLEGRKDLNRTVFDAMLESPSAAEDPETGVKALVLGYLGWYERNSDLGQYLFQSDSTEYLSSQVQLLHQSADTVLKRLMDWLRPFIDDGRVERFPAQLYFPLILGPSKEFVRRWLKFRSVVDFQEVRDILADAAWRAVCPPGKN